MRFLILFLFLCVVLQAKTIWVTQAGAGTTDGSTLGNAFSAAKFNASGNWGAGAGKITAGDTVKLSGTFTSNLTAQASGTSTSVPTVILGDGVLTGAGTGVSWSAGTTILPGFSFGANSFLVLTGCGITQSGTPGYYPVTFAGNTSCVVEGNKIYTTYLDGVNGSSGTSSSNIIRHNWFYDIGGTGGGAGGGSNPNVISITGNHNLVEYNTVGLSMDRCRFFGTANICRNNYWGATDTTNYASSPQHPSHTDGFQSFEGGSALIQFLYERNYDTDNADSIGGTNAHAFLIQDSVGTNGFQWCIRRFNVVIRPGGSAGAAWQNMAHVYAYNDTMVASSNGIGTGSSAPGIYGDTFTFTYPSTHTAATSNLADVRNNLLAFSPKCLGNGGGPVENLPTNFTNGTNLFYNTSTQASYPAGGSPANLSHSDPLFTNGTGVAGHDDYSLTSSSPARNAGSGYTTASGSGSSSSTLTVTNAEVFCDGWSIADADTIFDLTTNGTPVKISSISGNVITLSATSTWSNGDTWALVGQKDVGAIPYGTVSPTATITNVSTTYTATVTGNARMVEFLEDGVPKSLVYASPYTYAAGAGVVTANVYSLYADASAVKAATAPTGPTLTSATIGSNGTSIAFLWSAAVNKGDFSGMVITNSATNSTISYSSGDTTTTLNGTIPITAYQGATFTNTYTQSGSGINAVTGGANVTSYGPVSTTNNSTQAIPIPTSPSATKTGQSSIDVAWTKGDSQETFIIYRSLTNGSFVQIGTAGVNVQIYHDSGLAAGTQYFYTVSATGQGVSTSQTSSVNATTDSSVASTKSLRNPATIGIAN